MLFLLWAECGLRDGLNPITLLVTERSDRKLMDNTLLIPRCGHVLTLWRGTMPTREICVRIGDELACREMGSVSGEGRVRRTPGRTRKHP